MTLDDLTYDKALEIIMATAKLTTVVDVGSARYGGDYSIERLIEEFEPEYLYAFDPNQPDGIETINGAAVTRYKAAAWTYDGTIGYVNAGLSGFTDESRRPKVTCVDLARFILGLPETRIILKLDCEGSEYGLLEHLIATGADRRLELAWVEWHGDRAEERASIEDRLACMVAEWRW